MSRLANDTMTPEEWRRLQGLAPEEPAKHHQERGKRAQASGASFEDDLDECHRELYAAEGIAYIDRLPVPTSPMPKKAAHLAGFPGVARILSRRQISDFAGFLGPALAAKVGRPELRGRAVYLEAKQHADANRLPIVRDEGRGSGLQGHQLRRLVEAGEAGALGFVAWRDGAWRGLATPDVLRDALTAYDQGGRRSIERERFLEWSPPEDGMEDWLWFAAPWISSFA